MTLVYLFRKLVFAQVLLGIVAFCMAEPGGNPGLMLIAGTLCTMSWYIVEGPAGKPLPQWAINLAALAAVLWLGVDMWIQDGNVIIAMGHFTMWLQILQLYGHKSNREYGLVLVLSMLQMVGASILSITMVFGLLLGAYSVLSLFTILLFQFKATSDEVLESTRSAAPRGIQVGRPAPVVCRGHRWQFRLMAAFIGMICSVTSVVTFVLIPRTSRTMDSALMSALSRAQVGFNSRVQLGGPPPLEGSREPVLHLEVSQRRDSFLLRGAVLDHYNRHSKTWIRGQQIKSFDIIYRDWEGETNLIDLPAGAPTLNATVTLRSNRQLNLFTLYPMSSFASGSLSSVVINPYDQQASLEGPASSAVAYVVTQPLQRDRRLSEDDFLSEYYARGWQVEAEVFRQYALTVLRERFNDPELDRDEFALHDPRDMEFMRVLEHHLQTTFAYSLNFTPSGQRDPIAEFLTTRKEGHCELFASALAAMARSLGIRARVVTGYRASEFNGVGDYYVVRERHAHAWTEADCGPHGWRTFDATPPAEIDRRHLSGGIFAGVRNLYEHLEFLWIDTFVTYDKETREEMLGSLSKTLRDAAGDRGGIIGTLVGWISDLPELWRLNQVNFALMAVIVVFIVVGVASLVRRTLIRRRRLAALQLTRLPRGQRRQLARRLGFYLQMLDMLERHGHLRPVWQSPFDFATALAGIDPLRFAPVIALTQEFYEIRFGHRELNNERDGRIRAHLKTLEDSLFSRSTEPSKKRAA